MNLIEQSVVAPRDRISVVIPVYKRKEPLREAIESVLNQTVSAMEVVIIDDASPIDLRPVVESFADQRIRYYKLKKNRGAGYARNVGVRLARGDIIAFLDSDDVWYKNKLELQLKEMKNSSADVVYCSVNTEVEDQALTMEAKYRGSILSTLLKRGNVVVGGFSSIFMKKDLFRKVRGIRPTLKSRQDYEFHLRLSMAGAGYAYVSQPCLFFKTVGAGRITTNHRSRIMGILEVSRLYRPLFLEAKSPKYFSDQGEAIQRLVLLKRSKAAGIVWRCMLKSIMGKRILEKHALRSMLKGLLFLLGIRGQLRT